MTAQSRWLHLANRPLATVGRRRKEN